MMMKMKMKRKRSTLGYDGLKYLSFVHPHHTNVQFDFKNLDGENGGRERDTASRENLLNNHKLQVANFRNIYIRNEYHLLNLSNKRLTQLMATNIRYFQHNYSALFFGLLLLLLLLLWFVVEPKTEDRKPRTKSKRLLV